ncbi:hypothetical protein KC622_01320 [Candidatus Dojkabacteria bacterium]|uniref:HhH-GPD domain-containing protein n=1 Tax=Candidatus Dojkabacteria bacterium TaxID=2099670 RepID=A0A955HX23_9BACT|nr:hypothetical protein [Candidatus Dojkabacteria bacterium]MCB9790542.1 hypothetical protein [Candidatus Nomurabacteria bacterium]
MTFLKPDHFTLNGEEWSPGERSVGWVYDRQPLGLIFKDKGTERAPEIEVSVYSQRGLNEDALKAVSGEIAYRYNLTLDLSDFYKKFDNHRALGPVIKRMYGMRPGQPSSLYEYLIIGMVLQNATVRRSKQMYDNLIDNFGTQISFAGHTDAVIWNPGRMKQVSEDTLRALKVGYRAKRILKTDEQFASGEFDEQKMRSLSVDDQRNKLLSIYGVGPATTWYLLFDVFHNWDYIDHISPWEQKIYSKIFFDQDPETPIPVEKLLQHFNQFSPYKHLAVHYFWEDLWWEHKKSEAEWLKNLIRD